MWELGLEVGSGRLEVGDWRLGVERRQLPIPKSQLPTPQSYLVDPAKFPAFTIVTFAGSMCFCIAATICAGVRAETFCSSASSHLRVRLRYSSCASSEARPASCARLTCRPCSHPDLASLIS